MTMWKIAPVGNIPVGYIQVLDSQSGMVKIQINLKFDNRETSYIEDHKCFLIKSHNDGF
jgi:hypothetical protein